MLSESPYDNTPEGEVLRFIMRFIIVQTTRWIRVSFFHNECNMIFNIVFRREIGMANIISRWILVAPDNTAQMSTWLFLSKLTYFISIQIFWREDYRDKLWVCFLVQTNGIGNWHFIHLFYSNFVQGMVHSMQPK